MGLASAVMAAKKPADDDTRSMRIPDDLWAQVTEAASAGGVGRAEWVRRQLQAGVEKRTGGPIPQRDQEFDAAMLRVRVAFGQADTAGGVRAAVVHMARILREAPEVVAALLSGHDIGQASRPAPTPAASAPSPKRRRDG